MATAVDKMLTRFFVLEKEYTLSQSTVTKDVMLKMLEEIKPLNIMAYAVCKRKCKQLGLI